MYSNIPYIVPNAPANAGLLSSGLSFLKKINWSSFLSNTQKVLNVANQAIPLYYQAKPVFQNIRTLGKIGKAFNNTSNTSNTNISNNNINNNINNDIPNPSFFI